MNAEEVAAIVQRHLDGYKPAGVPIKVVEEGVRQDGAWWRVPVRLLGEIPRRYHYYDDLANAEEDIREQEQLEVLLVPAG